MRTIFRSFNRNIGRILAYIAVGLIITLLSNFLNIGIVQASISDSIIFNDAFGTNLDIGDYFRDMDRGVDYYASLRTGNGYSNSENGYTLKYSYISSDINFTTGTKGIGISQCGLSFVKDNYYSVNFYYITREYKYVHNLYSHNKIGLAHSWRTALGDMSIVPLATSSGANILQIAPNLYLQINSVTFKADKTASCVAIPTNYNGGGLKSQDLEFVGYTTAYQGTEPPSNAEVISKIQSESSKIQQNIDSMKEQQEQTNQKLDETNQNLENIDDTLNNSDVSGASGSADDFFGSFDDKDYGLSDIITLPLATIKKITNTTCSPLSITLPFVNYPLSLPCMLNIYHQYFNPVLTIYQTITTGLIGYWVCVNIFKLVKNFKDPESDQIEVLDL